MGKEIWAFVNKARKKLNLILAGARTFGILIWAGFGAAIPALLLAWFGLQIPAGALWASLVVLCAAIALFFAIRSRLDSTETAVWLDRRLATNDGISAAVNVLERGTGGRFDGIVIERANTIVRNKPKPSWPYRALLRNGTVGLASLIAGFLVVFFVQPGAFKLAPFDIPNSGLRQASPRELIASTPAPQPADAAKRAEALAKLLFPKDPNLRARAAQAIARGDAKALDELLDAADKALQKQIDEAKTPEEKRALQEQKQQRDQVSESQAMQDELQKRYGQAQQDRPPGNNQDDKDDDSTSRGQGSQGKGQEQGKQQNGGSGSPDQRQNRPQGNSGGKDGEGQGGSQGDGKGGTTPPLKADLSPTLQDKEVSVGDSRDPPNGSMVLTEKGPRIPLNANLGQASRSAEAAVSRSGVPVSYEEYVRAYFASLGNQ